MIPVSNDFKIAMKQPIKEIDAYISGDISIKSEDDLISFKISCDTGMCKTAMRKLEAKYLGEHNLLGQWVHVGYGVRLADGTFEYLDFGSFLVTEMTTVKDTGVTTVIGYDKMVSTMIEYSKLNVEYPIKLIDYIKLLCNNCNVEIANDVIGDNLFNPNTKRDNYTLAWASGSYYADTGSVSSDYIPCKNTTTLSSNYKFVPMFYDKDKKYLGNSEDLRKTAGYYYNTMTVPNDIDIAYCRVFYKSSYNDNMDMTTLDDIMLTQNDDVSYIAYNVMNDWQITKELWENINGITYRDILVQVAQATATTCIIGNDDKIYFKRLNATGEQLTYSNMKKLKLEPMYGEINSVVLSRTPQEDNVYRRDETSIANNGLTEFKIENNEIIDKNRDEAMDYLYPVLKGISYYPFETVTEGLGWYEIADSFDIVNDNGDVFNTSLFNFSITVDGSIKETLKTVADTKTQTQYQYASQMAKRIKNTEIIVDKQEQTITNLVEDMYSEGGIVNESFTKVEQNIHNIVNSVQNSGGNNLIKNSVMFAYDNDKNPNNWYIANGINIFDGQYELANINSNTGNKVVSTAIISTVNFHPVDENLTFTLQFPYEATGCIIFCYDKDKKYINYIGLSIKNINGVRYTTFTTLPNTKYIMWRFNNGFTDLNAKSQLELGFKISEYKDFIEGTIDIDSNVESFTAGGLSGHSFTLVDKIATQKIAVSTDNVYTFSTKIKKDITGSCYVKIYNSNEEYIINIPAGENVFYKDYVIKELTPKDNYYILEFYGSADSNATFTDNMLAIGSYKSQWQQANGEVMNTQVNINLEGVLVKSTVYLGDYTVMSPLEFAGYSKINGIITKVFSLNKDVTLVKKLEAEDEVKMVPIKIVPITSGDKQGWAFVPST